jgi:hypothetical protein
MLFLKMEAELPDNAFRNEIDDLQNVKGQDKCPSLRRVGGFAAEYVIAY